MADWARNPEKAVNRSLRVKNAGTPAHSLRVERTD